VDPEVKKEGVFQGFAVSVEYLMFGVSGRGG
jgi:hypothetical protein